MSKASKPLAAPPGAGTVYLVLVLTGIVLGLLCGADQIELGVLTAFGAGGIVVFLSWSIWRLDPAYLLRSEHYRDEPPDSSASKLSDS